MKKTLTVAVVVVLLCIPVAIIYQIVHQLHQPRVNDRSAAPLAKELSADPGAKGGGGKAPKGPKDGPGSADKAKKADKGKKKSVEVTELPAAVKSALEKVAGNAEFSKLEKEAKDGQDIYKAKWGPKTAESELKLAADGTPLEAKEMVAFDTLPDAVRTAINQAQPAAKTFECKRFSTFADGNVKVAYEVRGQADGEKLPHLQVSAEGAIREGKGGKGASYLPR